VNLPLGKTDIRHRKDVSERKIHTAVDENGKMKYNTIQTYQKLRGSASRRTRAIGWEDEMRAWEGVWRRMKMQMQLKMAVEEGEGTDSHRNSRAGMMEKSKFPISTPKKRMVVHNAKFCRN
jgi:hypothetical protein